MHWGIIFLCLWLAYCVQKRDCEMAQEGRTMQDTLHETLNAPENFDNYDDDNDNSDDSDNKEDDKKE